MKLSLDASHDASVSLHGLWSLITRALATSGVGGNYWEEDTGDTSIPTHVVVSVVYDSFISG